MSKYLLQHDNSPVGKNLALALHFLNLENWALRTSRAVVFKLNHFKVAENSALEGLKILQLSDLHLDSQSANVAKIKRLCRQHKYDMCVITGDFMSKKIADYTLIRHQLNKLKSVFNCNLGCYAVSGNHDHPRLLKRLPHYGIKLIDNDHIKFNTGQGDWVLGGVSDPHCHNDYDLNKASPRELPYPSILLAHSPDLVHQAYYHFVNFYLCGHTHGGQLCLPGGIPILNNSHVARRFIHGSWQRGMMQGYTSAGSGCTGLPLRINCPPEVTLHHFLAA
ncbi:MAG: metallophosphoesterase [Pseudomonadales bacterium]